MRNLAINTSAVPAEEGSCTLACLGMSWHCLILLFWASKAALTLLPFCHVTLNLLIQVIMVWYRGKMSCPSTEGPSLGVINRSCDFGVQATHVLLCLLPSDVHYYWRVEASERGKWDTALCPPLPRRKVAEKLLPKEKFFLSFSVLSGKLDGARRSGCGGCSTWGVVLICFIAVVFFFFFLIWE